MTLSSNNYDGVSLKELLTAFTVNRFHKRVPSEMFDRDLNMPMITFTT